MALLFLNPDLLVRFPRRRPSWWRRLWRFLCPMNSPL